MAPMSTPDDARPPAQRLRALMVSHLGSVVHRTGDWMPIGGTVELLGQAGVDPASVRTAVFRLKKRGWLDSESRDGVRGYALTGTALAELTAGDEIIWHSRRPADLAQGWCVINFSIPEARRHKRHQLRSHLTALGFGNIGAAVWIAPARMRAAAEKAIAEQGLTGQCAVFVGDYVGGKEMAALLNEAWDLAGIDGRYRHFVDAYAATDRDLAARSSRSALPRREAFVRYLEVIDHWRRLPYRDPGLPAEVLPEDWPGPAATALFERLVAALEEPALAHVAEVYRGLGVSPVNG
jgi:phenylacetic acid degradation operon negative regulatory protein